MVDDDEDHGGCAQEDGETEEVAVGNHLGLEIVGHLGQGRKCDGKRWLNSRLMSEEKAEDNYFFFFFPKRKESDAVLVF